MKKAALILSVLISVILISACSQKEEKKDTISNPITDPGGYTQDMVNLNKNMQKNIQDSVDKENQKLEDALNETETGSSGAAESLSKKYTAAVISTNYGDIKINFDAANAPKTVENFLKLAKEGFYDGTKFHRVIKSFMIQGGDPLSKDDSMKSRWGTGGPGYQFSDELKGTEKYTQGTLAMANSGPNTNGSQFFIVTASPNYPLQPNYTVFAHVESGMDTALKIENVKTETSDRPVENVVIKSVKVMEK